MSWPEEFEHQDTQVGRQAVVVWTVAVLGITTVVALLMMVVAL